MNTFLACIFLALAVHNISSSYQIGYGVFQDKVVMPFTDTSDQKLINPCIQFHGIKCAPPFEFMHLLSMTKNITEFKDKVNKTVVSGNLDRPEGSFDAIVQAVACKDEIGWRTTSHKLLIFATNDKFHMAGDGRLGGIVIPNDLKCHVDANGKYTKELEQDYPSISQLADIIEKNEVNTVFAVSSDQVSLFKKLSDRIHHSTVELLINENRTSQINLKEIIEKKYKEMLSEVEIVHSKVKGIDIQIRATSEYCQQKGTNKCRSVNDTGLTGIQIHFEVDVKVTQCPTNDEERIKKVVIYPASMKSDQLVLEIETVCECSCSADQATWEFRSEVCSAGNGTLKCGICDCHDGHFGQFCECDSSGVGTANNSTCIRPRGNLTELCSGSGKCECGVCKCNKGYSGKYCECNEQLCGNFQREICGGAHGVCVCGKCVCEPAYTGNACECPVSNFTCINDEKICNDAGICECGECRCKKGYIGKYCENCFLCGDTVCAIETYRDCVDCAVFGKNDWCNMSCPAIKLVNTLENTEGSHVCTKTQADGCFISFRVTTTDDNITILVDKITSCPKGANFVPIIAGVVGGVVAIGLFLLLLWKILTSIFDRIKYRRFQDDFRRHMWSQQDNSFYYDDATTTYKNPLLDTSDTADYNK